MAKFGLKEEEIEKINAIFTAFPDVDEVFLYGSRALGNFQAYSDIDLTIVGSNLNLTILQKIEMELDDLLLPYKIDLSLFHQIDNEDLIAHINSVGVLFFKKKIRQAD